MEFKRWQHGWWIMFFKRVVLAWGFYGNCGKELTFHFDNPLKGLLSFTIRNFHHYNWYETSFYIRLGQKIQDRRVWGVDMDSEHLLWVFTRIFRQRVNQMRWDMYMGDSAEFIWGPFKYVRQEAPHGLCQYLYFFGHSICIDI